MFKKIMLFTVIMVSIAGIAFAGKINLPETGQTTSYATGDDGNLLWGVSSPNPRFTDNSDGTVTDNLTGLIWLKAANCFSTRNWATANTDANGLANAFCGLSDGSTAGDWRLPNLNELESLIDAGESSPALPTGHPFSSVQADGYWSATTYAPNSIIAWIVGMVNGSVDVSLKSSDVSYVWPVRAGQ